LHYQFIFDPEVIKPTEIECIAMGRNLARFITLEGIDGCGKSTQSKLLKEFLSSKGIDAELTREPGGTRIGKEIRQVLQNPENHEMIHETELLLYLADRLQHLQEMVVPLLAKGKWVISDRFHDSTVAYQGGGRCLDLAFLDSIVRKKIQPFQPDKTFVLLLSPEIALERLRQRVVSSGAGLSRLDLESVKFFQRVDQSFRELLQRDPTRCQPIDASQSMEKIQHKIQSQLPEEWLL
jgi:dTMP kinase